jgi:phosphoglycolate phosphatase-like HAD superfamily hydrolase
MSRRTAGGSVVSSSPTPGREGPAPRPARRRARRPLIAVGAAVLGVLIATASVASAASAGDAPATALRLTLGRLLAEHAYLTMEGMRATALGAPERDAARETLDQNTAALADAFGSVYGDEAGTRFRQLWQEHIDALFAYASAAASSDTGATEEAEAALTAFRAAFGTFLSSANPHLSADAEAEALQLHLDQLTAYVDGDYARAAATGRAAYTHMFELGDHLARGIADQYPTRFTGANIAFSPKAELRVALGRLLGEHLVLSAEAMRAALGDAPDADGATRAIGANSVDLAAAIGRLYGDAAGTAFEVVWTRHTDAYIAYIAGVRDDDAEAQQQALAQLHGYHVEIASFLADANPNLDEAAVQELIRQHVEALIGQVDAYAAGDYRRSMTIVRDAYAHMFTVGDALADAIAAQFPGRFADLAQAPATATVPDGRGEGAALWVPALAVVAIGLVLLHVTSGPRRRRRVPGR